MTLSPPAYELSEAACRASRVVLRGSPVTPAAHGALLAVMMLALAACSTLVPNDSAPAGPTEIPVIAAPPVVAKPELAPQAELAPAPEQIEEKNIYFESASTTVGVHGKIKLRAHADRLKADPASLVTLVGHTDDLGSRNYNLALAEQRILSVSNLLRKYGVRRKQIRRYRGDSERVPNSCKSAECRQKMRRVELVYPQP